MVVSKSFIKTWFALQHQLIAGLQVAYVELHGNGVPAGGLVVSHPEELDRKTELALAAELTRRSGAPVTGKGGSASDGPTPLRVAYPLRLGALAHGAIVVEVEAPLDRQAAILELLKWGEAWLNLALNQRDDTASVPAFGAVIDEGLSQNKYRDSLTAVLGMLPDRVQCTRVALGRYINSSMRVEAVSDVGEFDARSVHVKAIKLAMQEALIAGKTLYWPYEESGVETSSAQCNLVETASLSGVCTVPVVCGLRSPLVFSFEFALEAPWGEQVYQRCDEATRIVAPLIELRRETNQSWWNRLTALWLDGLRRLGGSKRRTQRLILALSILLFSYLAIGYDEYKVSAPAVIEGSVQRAVVAPFDGFITQALVRAGQEVAEGDLLARLDDLELQSERRRMLAEEAALVNQHRQAVATLDHAETRILEAQLAQTRARLTLLDDQLTRTRLRAPLEGLIISGDWSRSLGVPVSRGELLFEVAPLHSFRVTMQVSDRDIAGLAAGQVGGLTLSALPRQEIRFSVTDIAARAPDEGGEPAFRVEAKLVNTLPYLRPGMEGIAKVVVDERQRWWIWTHTLTDWLHLQIWRWRP